MMDLSEGKIYTPKPKCFLKWEGDTEGLQFAIYRDFNWF